MFLNISQLRAQIVWLSLFPTFTGGVRLPPLNTPETLAVPTVPTVPPFPRFFFTGTNGRYGDLGGVSR